MLLLIYVGYIALSAGLLWPLAFWAGQKRHPAVLAVAVLISLATLALVIYAFTGTLPLHHRTPQHVRLAQALAPLLWLLLLAPLMLCIAIAQTCVRCTSRSGIATQISYGCGTWLAGIAPLALLASAQGLAGVSL